MGLVGDVDQYRYRGGERKVCVMLFFYLERRRAYEMLRGVVGAEMCI